MANKKISQLTGATTPLAGTEVLPIVQGGATVKVSVDNLTTGKAVTVGSLTDTGNLTFTGTGNRITGDFSNATVASRVMFQTSTANSPTFLYAIPSGTSQIAAITAANASDPTNCSWLDISPNNAEARIRSGINGTGTYLPMTFYTGGSERVRIDTSGNVGIGTASPAAKLDVIGTSGGATPLTVRHPGNSSFGTVAQIKTTGGTDDPVISLENYNGGSPVRYGISCTDDGSMIFKSGAYEGGFGTERMRINSSGIVTMNAYGAGAATFSAAGVISSVSDETWKIKDGVPVDPDSMIKKLEPGYWYYNDEKKEIFGIERQLGFYAQNVHNAIGPEAAPQPEIVTTKGLDGKDIVTEKPWGYYDRSVLAVTVMSLQKALLTIESLTDRIKVLEAK